MVAVAAPRKRHLFIFAGENNMESIRPERTVIPVLKKDKELRKSDLLWVREARREMSMHDMDEGWRDSEGKAKKKYGPDYKVKQTKNYKRLLANARQSAKKKPCPPSIRCSNWMSNALRKHRASVAQPSSGRRS